ncbi:homoserine kinase [uncultured Tessaracoccus sp.]|uniref:homoserine kinase n=1 Tax=uncultured Tessaracoccus sp. TaxID=905023 RepID=UPI0025D2BCCE|nr:homoserine kinase [uncultured Tessaracoccus sp.]
MRVRVPATTANVGSGFDCVGIALDWYDEVELTPGGDVRVEVSGEGADVVPRDETHLVVRSVHRALDEWGDGRRPGFTLRAHNTIPHARGLGSSAAAIVAGLALGWGLARDDAPDRTELARVASLVEGHADNAAAAVHGGATLGWIDGDEVSVHALRLDPALSTRVWVPTAEVPTSGARAVLPDAVPHRDAVAQAASAAMLVHALAVEPALLLRATADRIHQRQRASLMGPSLALVDALRELGVPAAISGAGPSVFAIGTADQFALAFQLETPGFRCAELPVGGGVELHR